MRNKDNMPFLIYLSLLGINRRWQAWFFVWLCVALGVGMAALAIAIFTGLLPLLPDAVMPIGILSVFSAFSLYGCAWWYWYALRWVDRHSSWG